MGFMCYFEVQTQMRHKITAETRQLLLINEVYVLADYALMRDVYQEKLSHSSRPTHQSLLNIVIKKHH